MCAIVDANVVSEVFGSNLPPAGEESFTWLNKGSGRLVVGGKLLEELETGSENFRRWGQEAQLAGKMRILDKSEVDARTEQIQNEGSCGRSRLGSRPVATRGPLHAGRGDDAQPGCSRRPMD